MAKRRLRASVDGFLLRSDVTQAFPINIEAHDEKSTMRQRDRFATYLGFQTPEWFPDVYLAGERSRLLLPSSLKRPLM